MTCWRRSRRSGRRAAAELGGGSTIGHREIRAAGPGRAGKGLWRQPGRDRPGHDGGLSRRPHSLPLLYTSGGQVNVRAPSDLAVNTRRRIGVRREDALSAPDSPPLPATAQPGIFTHDLSRGGQGLLVKSDRLTLAEPRTPAPHAQTIVPQATGLGPVRPAVRTGEPTAFSPLAATANPVTVTFAVR